MSCPVCYKQIKPGHSLTKYHMDRVYPELLYCNECTYTTFQRSYYYEHMRTHKLTKKQKLKKKINAILLEFKREKANPNHFFNYQYYTSKPLNELGLEDFLKELQAARRSLKSLRNPS